jgi:MFS family permease
MQALKPLLHRDFRLLWTGMSLSLLGDGVLLVALVWQVYQLDNHPGAMATVGVALTVPHVVLVLLGGVISDRFERRVVMLAADVMRAAALLVLALLAVTEALELWHLIAFAAVYGAASAFFMPAFDALIPDVVPESDLVEANALDQFVRPAALWLLGPALGGAIVSLGGSGVAFALDAATFAISAPCLSRMSRQRTTEPSAITLTATVSELRDGFRYVREQRWLWATFVAATFTYLLFLGPTEVLLPYLIRNDLGGSAGDLGLVLAAGGLASVAAALLVGQTGLPKRTMVLTYAVWSLATLGVAGYGIAQSRWQAMIAAAFIAGFETVGAVAWTTTKQRLVPAGMLGRVSSVDWFISIALVPLSYALTAPAAAAFGIRETLVGAGVLGAAVTCSFLFIPGVQQPDRVLEAVPA